MIFKYKDVVKFVAQNGIVNLGEIVRVDLENNTVDVQPMDSGAVYTVPAQDVVLAYDHMKNDKKNETNSVSEHYEKLSVQPIDIIADWPVQQQIGALRFCAIKYLVRLGNKDCALSEAKKAHDFTGWLVKVLNGENVNPRE